MKVFICQEAIHFNEHSKILESENSLEIIEPDFDKTSSQLRRQFCMKVELPKFLQNGKEKLKSPETKIYIDHSGQKKLIARFI